MKDENEIQLAWKICNLINRLNDFIWDRYESEFIEQYLKLEEEKYWQSQLDKDPLWDTE